MQDVARFLALTWFNLKYAAGGLGVGRLLGRWGFVVVAGNTNVGEVESYG